MQRLLVSALLLGGSVFAGGTATAQTAPQGQSGDAPEVEAVIVTAQNRAEDVQDVPIAISVVSGDALRAAGVTDFTSVMRVSPSLQVTSDTSQTRVTVRGVGTLSNNEAQDQSIAVNIDGEYINRPTILNAAIFDMDRVEVLRGPQGTLYGKNSTGGAVNFITRKPGSRFAVNASAAYGNYDQVNLEGGVDIPLGEVGAVRVAGIYADRDGYSRHTNTPITTAAYQPSALRRSGDEHTVGGRVSLRLEPMDALRIDAALERVEQDFHPTAYGWVNLNAPGFAPGAGCSGAGWVEVGPGTPGTQCVPANTNFLSGIDRKTYDMALSGVSVFHQDTTAVRGRLAYDFGVATFTYTGGYRESENTGGNALPVAYNFLNFGASVKTQSHEWRLNGVFGGVQWQGGVFHFKEEQATNGGLYLPFIGPKGGYINYFQHPTDSRSWSVFGQVEAPVIEDKLTLVAGLRYTKDKRDAVFNNYGFVPNSGPVPLTGAPAQRLVLGSSGDKVTYLAGVNYTPNEDTLIYAKVSTGYKGGGFDSVGTFKPETNTAFEGGLKLSFGQNRQHLFNVAGFYYDYKDLQNDALLNPAIGAQTFNAGKATIWGIEAEGRIRVTADGTLSASANYLNAEYDDFLASYNVLDIANPGLTALDPALDAPPNLGGNRLPQAPRWVLALGYDHVFDLGEAGSLTARAYVRYKSRYYLDYFNQNDSLQKGFTQTDLSLDYETRDERYAVQLFVRNLEDKRPLVHAAYIAAGPDDIYNWAFAPPRTYGVRLSVKY